MKTATTLLATLITVCFCGCSESGDSPAGDQSPSVYSDASISFPVPEGGTVQLAGENSYFVYFGEEEIHYLMLRGAEEPDDHGRQRTEAARIEAFRRAQEPVEGAVISDISEITRHEIGGEPVYVFIHAATVEDEDEGVDRTGYNTIGFGSVGGVSIWFQHTSERRADHPATVLGFLQTITFKKKGSELGSE